MIAQLIGALCVVTAFVSGALALSGLLEMRSARHQDDAISRRMGEAAARTVGNVPHDMQVRRFKRLAETGFGRKLRDEMSQAGLVVSFDQLISRVLWACALSIAGGTLLLRSVIPGIVLAAGIVVGMRLWIDGRADKRIERMRSQLPDALTALSNGLAVGMSLQQALAHAAEETPEPLRHYFERVVDDVTGGMGLGDALDALREQVPLRELATVSAALEIQRHVGGNVRELLEQATESVREAAELRLSLKAKTAQGRMSSKVVGVMPLGLTGLIMLVDPSYVQPFLKTTVGNIFLIGALMMLAAGFVLIQKVVEVDI